MAMTFRVDDVDPAATAPPTRTLGEHLGAALAIGGDAGMRVLDTQGVHPLLAAVHAAFAEHRPLVLSPDAVWREPVFVRLRSDALATLAHEDETPGEIDEVTGLRRDELQLVRIEVSGCPAARSSEVRESIPVVGKSVAAILAQVLRSGGATELPVVSTLIDELPAWARP